MKYVKIKSYNDKKWIVPLSLPIEQRINQLIQQYKIISLKIDKNRKRALKNGKKEQHV